MQNLTRFDKIFGGGLLAGKKSYIVSAVLVVTAVAGYLTGEYTLAELVTQLGQGGGLAALRAGISKAGAS